jgi:phytoene dehydrogenase-like protein
MSAAGNYDAVLVGSGPNGLAAAITLAEAGWKVLVLEARDSVGGGTRTAELTLPGFHHDVCSAIHPLALASPFFRSLPMAELGLEIIQPPAPLAHPLDGGIAVTMERSLDSTVSGLGEQGRFYRSLMQPFVRNWEALIADFLGPLRFPRKPIPFTRFGLSALQPAGALARWRLRGQRSRALFAGLAAHSMLPLDQLTSGAYGLILGLLGHAVGWPLIKGGSQRLTQVLLSHLRNLGGVIEFNAEITSLDQLPSHRVALFDLTPRQLLGIAGDALPAGYKRQLERYRYGSGVFKLDWALDAPIPWTAQACLSSATLHIGGTLEEIADAERQVWEGKHPRRPFVLLAQQSLFDPTRAPEGKHTAWAYCHVPHGSTVDMTEPIEGQIERFAPGFRDRILARSSMNAQEMQAYNPNYIGGDINGGVQNIWQLFTRPTIRLNPYSTPNPKVFLCSSSTPPGGGVHGMCGVFAARAVLRADLNRTYPGA